MLLQIIGCDAAESSPSASTVKPVPKHRVEVKCQLVNEFFLEDFRVSWDIFGNAYCTDDLCAADSLLRLDLLQNSDGSYFEI